MYIDFFLILECVGQRASKSYVYFNPFDIIIIIIGFPSLSPSLSPHFDYFNIWIRFLLRRV